MMVALDALYNGSPGCHTEAAAGSGLTTPLNFKCMPDRNQPPTPAELHTENYDHDVIYEHFPLGSGNGIAQLRDRGLANVATIDFARSSRGESGADPAGLRFVAYAKDAVPWVSFREGPSENVTNLTHRTNQGNLGRLHDHQLEPDRWRRCSDHRLHGTGRFRTRWSWDSFVPGSNPSRPLHPSGSTETSG